MKQNTAEIIEFNPNQLSVFDEFTNQLATLEVENNKAVFDYESPRGNKEARSHVYKLRQTKSAVELARKQAKEDALNFGRKVDARAKEIRDKIDGMIEIHEKPLREIEEREAARVSGHRSRIETLTNFQHFPQETTAGTWAAELEKVEGFVIDESLDEFMAEAAIKKDAALSSIRVRLAARQKLEAEQAELARHRREQQEREQRERDERIAREAREKAEAEAKAKNERDQQEQARREKERAEREEKEKAEREAETERLRREKAEAETRALAAEKAAREQAELDHRKRLFEQQQAAEKREADEKHRAAVNNEIKSALITAGISDQDSEKVIAAIAGKKIPHVSIQY